MDARRFNEIVGKIYDAATDPAAMSQLAEAIARAFDTHSAMLYLHRKPDPTPEFVQGLSRTPNFDAWAYSSYSEYYHLRDEWYARGIRRGLNVINLGEEMIADAQFERTEFCNDFCKRLDAFRVIGTSFQVDDVLASIGIHRPRRLRRFDKGDREMLSLLVPHLQRAAQIHRRLQIAERNCKATLSLIEDLSVGVIIVDRLGRILFANAVAERVLRAGAGLIARNGRLRAERFSEGSALDRMVAEAAQVAGGAAIGSAGMLRLRSSPGAALRVLIAPLRSDSAGVGQEEPAVLVVFSDPAASVQVPEQVLCNAYRLTPAEARLVLALSAGEALFAYADRTGISRNTARTHIRQALAKTGCSRQADLVRLLCTDPAMRLASADRSPRS